MGPLTHGQCPSYVDCASMPGSHQSGAQFPLPLWESTVKSNSSTVNHSHAVPERTPNDNENGRKRKEPASVEWKHQKTSAPRIGAEKDQDASATLHRQKTNLYSKGKQLVDQLMELHKFGVLLEICPPDLYFTELLSKAKGRLLSSLQISGSPTPSSPVEMDGEDTMESGHSDR